MKSLIVYFSRRGENYNVGNISEGNAEHIAKIIQKLTGADIYQIEPVKEYSSSYMTCIKEAQEEVKTKARPEFKNPLDSLEQYNLIYLCYPNWWGSFPRIVATFLERYDFSGKIIKPMCTHEGSGFGNSLSELKEILHDATIKNGLSIQGTKSHSSDEEIKNWVNE